MGLKGFEMGLKGFEMGLKEVRSLALLKNFLGSA